MNLKTIALAGCLSACATATMAMPNQTSIDKMEVSSVQIEMPKVGLCSGQVIFSSPVKHGDAAPIETYILTAKHCTKDLPDEAHVLINVFVHNDRLRTVEKKVFDANVAGQSYKSDIALIKLRDSKTVFPTTPVAPSSVNLQFGQDVVTIGYPLGLSQTLTEGNLGFVDDADGFFDDLSESHQFLRSTPSIAPGSSGGAMFTDVNGTWEQIGVVTGGWNVGTFLNYYTPIEEINDYLSVALPKAEVTKAN